MKVVFGNISSILQVLVQKRQLAEFTFPKQLFSWNSSVAVPAHITNLS